MFTRALVLAVGCTFAFGCGSEPVMTSEEEIQEITDNLKQVGYVDSDIMVSDGLVYVQQDAVVSLEASREMLTADVDTQEQYRTTNLVSRNLAVICINGAAFTNAKFSNALNAAIANYNAEPLTFNMRRTTGSTAGCNAVITARLLQGVTGGSAGFPSGGRPFNNINIGTGLQAAQFSTATVEHVITHELGHTVGLRHSDFFNRAISCGSGGNEGSGGVGAIHIAGTPTGATVGGSLMNSCFRSSESGNFTASDRTALNALY